MNTPSDNNDDIRRLFSAHIPEIAGGEVEVKGIARETGRRIIVAVHASDVSVCAVGACVGQQGSRVKTMMRALPGDKIDVVRWSDSLQDFIGNLLAPAKVEQIAFDTAAHRAIVTVAADSMTLPKDGGIRLRLASRLAGWDLHLIES